MMAYQAQPGMHPGMAHGHPGMAPNPAQHMGQPMMHPGVSGPGQPHVSQAGAMMGVQPGASGPMGGMGGQHPGMGMPGQPGHGMGGQSLAGGGQNMVSHMNPQQIMQQQQQRALLQRQQAQQRSQAFQQMQAAQAAAQAQAQTRPSSQTPGFCILKVNLLADDLSRFDMSNGKDLNAWNDFTEKHFAPEGRLMHSFDDKPDSKAKVYEVLRPTIARYFWT
ncbi:hypothetical protein KC331_g21993, partial [Hortaea werneckii]